MVADTLTMAIWRRGRPKELIYHSNQSGQYTSEPFQTLIAKPFANAIRHVLTFSITQSVLQPDTPPFDHRTPKIEGK